MFTNSNTINAVGSVGQIEKVADANSLLSAFQMAKKETGWKESVQRFESNLLLNICKLRKELLSGTYKQQDTQNFILHERGRERLIRAQPIRDRVAQRSFNDNVLEPIIAPRLIYDNWASLKKRGTSRGRKRFAIHLQKAYKEYGENAYVVQVDFSKYFDNILHDVCKTQFRRCLDAGAMAFVEQTVDSFKLNVSHLSDEEFKSINNIVLNSVELRKLRIATQDKMAAKSLGVGFHVSQICGIFYPNEIDTYIKIVKSMKYYGRYMDDLYLIANGRAEAEARLQEVERICKRLGIFVNKKKTTIRPIRRTHTFLKVNYTLTDTGRIIKRVHSSTIRRGRRRITTYRCLLEQGRMDFSHILNCFSGWLGSYRKFHSRAKLYKIKRLFQKTFKKEMRIWTKENSSNREFST